MISTALAFLSVQTLTLTPIDDLWIYPHATDPQDPYLRVWGVEGNAVPSDAGDAESYGLSYLKWSLAGLPSGSKLKEAKLVLTHIANPGFTLEQAKKSPIEARPIQSSFSEKTWKYEDVSKLLPMKGEDEVFGTGAPESLSGESITITVDLMKGKADFAKALENASKDREIAIALSSTLDMSALGRAGIYKLYSKDDRDEKFRPKLILTFEP